MKRSNEEILTDIAMIHYKHLIERTKFAFNFDDSEELKERMVMILKIALLLNKELNEYELGRAATHGWGTIVKNINDHQTKFKEGKSNE